MCSPLLEAQLQYPKSGLDTPLVPTLDLDDVLGRKNEFAGAVKEKLENAMSAYGYTIVQTLVIDVVPDERMKKAINENNAAALMRVTANEKLEAEMNLQIKRAEGEARLQINRAEGEAKLQLIRAEGEAKLQLIRAEGERQSGLGIAGRRQAIVDGLKESVLGFPRDVPGITAKDFMDVVLLTKYFDTLNEVGSSSKSSAAFIPHGLGAIKDVSSQIRDGILQASVEN